jgi:glyoxylase-like metal-dependent hydrolase (beta-lactamase superfamily II)
MTVFSGSIDGVGAFEIVRVALGSLTVPTGTPMGGRTLPVQAFLVNHPQGRLLFDTGLGDEYPAFDRLLAPTVRRPLETAFIASGVRAGDVQMVVNCHLHYDHAGGNPLFPGVPIFVQTREYEAAGELAYLIPERIDFPGADLRVLRGETQILGGVRAVPTPGHTPGHQSLVIDDEEGPVVLAGQAVYTVAEFADPEREPARGLKTASDPGEFLASLARLRGLNPRRMYFSHDEKAWEPEGATTGRAAWA